MKMRVGTNIEIDGAEGITEAVIINSETGEIVQFAHMEQFHGRDEDAQEFRDEITKSVKWGKEHPNG